MINLRNKKNIILAVLFSSVIISSSVMADGRRDPNFERLADRLELSQEQKNEFISVMETQHEKHKAEQESFRNQRKALMEQHRKETLSSLEGVLSEDQLAAFNAHMEKKKSKYGNKKMKHKNCH